MVSLLFLIALLSCWFTVWWFFGLRELQLLKYQYQYMTKTTTTVQSLANEALEYSRRNPAIDPILYHYEIKTRTAAAPAPPQPTAPSSKPAR
jgi:hypothetical protein